MEENVYNPISVYKANKNSDLLKDIPSLKRILKVINICSPKGNRFLTEKQKSWITRRVIY